MHIDAVSAPLICEARSFINSRSGASMLLLDKYFSKPYIACNAPGAALL
jgi:hypothetical protein